MSKRALYTYEEVRSILNGDTLAYRGHTVQQYIRAAYKGWLKHPRKRKYEAIVQDYIFQYFKEYAKEMATPTKVVTPKSNGQSTASDPYETLARAFESLQNAVVETVKAQVAVTMEKERAVYKRDIAEHEEEIKELKDTIQEAAKNSNLRYWLQQRLGGA